MAGGKLFHFFVGWCTLQFCECSLFGKPGIHDHGLRSAKKKQTPQAVGWSLLPCAHLGLKTIFFWGATSADGLAMKPSGSATVTKCGSEMDSSQLPVCQAMWSG